VPSPGPKQYRIEIFEDLPGHFCFQELAAKPYGAACAFAAAMSASLRNAITVTLRVRYEPRADTAFQGRA
jgi:hypothetical protein